MKKALVLALALLPLATGCAHREVVSYAYAPSSAYNDAAREGYADGVRAARHDMREGRRPDFDDHSRFRNPPVPPPLRDDYRHGFRDGYARAIHGGY